MYPQLQHLAALATAQASPGAGGCGGPDQLLLPLVLFAILYFVWLRPATNERKKHAEMLKNLKRGDRVITTSGMIGTVSDKTEKTVSVKVDKPGKVEVEMLTSAIARRFADADADAKAEPAKSGAAAKSGAGAKSGAPAKKKS